MRNRLAKEEEEARQKVLADAEARRLELEAKNEANRVDYE